MTAALDELLGREVSIGTRPSLGLRVQGRAPKEFAVEFVRELEVADLERLRTAPRGVKAPGVKKLREAHHQLARCLAQGMKQVEASAITGFSQSRISILCSDPAFQELLAFYQERINEKFVNLHERIAILGADAVTEVHERLLDNPETITMSGLLELTKLALDRAGHGPVTKSESRIITLDARDLAALKAAAGVSDARSIHEPGRLGQPVGGVIEGKAVPCDNDSPLGKPVSNGSGVPEGSAPGRSSEGYDLRENRHPKVAAAE